MEEDSKERRGKRGDGALNLPRERGSRAAQRTLQCSAPNARCCRALLPNAQCANERQRGMIQKEKRELVAWSRSFSFEALLGSRRASERFETCPEFSGLFFFLSFFFSLEERRYFFLYYALFLQLYFYIFIFSAILLMMKTYMEQVFLFFSEEIFF